MPNTAPTFFGGGDGKVRTDFGTTSDSGQNVTVQTDGKILVAGSSGGDFALARYNASGSLDSSFDIDGKVTTDLGSSEDFGRSVSLQADGKILVAGSSGNNFALVRYHTDGSLDTSFGSAGKVTTDFGSTSDYGGSVAAQADGKILVAGSSGGGFALARYNADGSPDTGFDTDGKVTTDFGSSSDFGLSLSVQADGRILVAGSSAGDFALARYNADGSLDTSFDTDGKVTTDLGSSGDAGRSANVQADGKILMAGYSGVFPHYDFGLVRYNANGSLDTSFDTDGKVRTDFGSTNDFDFAFGVALQADGKILAAGFSFNNNKADFALVRYNTDGSLDVSFDTDGKAATDFGSSSDSGSSVTVQADGKILVAGASDDDFALARYNTNGSLDDRFDPVDTLDGRPSFTEGSSAVVLDADVQIFDAQLSALNSGFGNYAGANLTLVRHGGANSQDVYTGTGSLSLAGGFVAISGTAIGTATHSAGSMSMSFFDGTQAQINSVMRQIAYSNTSDAPPASVQIDWSFSDGNSGAQGSGGPLSVTGSTSVTITSAKDGPVPTAGNVSATEDRTYTFVLSDFPFDDPDSGNALAKLKIVSLPASGTLLLNGVAAIAGLEMTAPVINAGLLTYVPAANATDQETFSFAVSNGLAYGAGSPMTITIANVNDAPAGSITISGTATQGQTLTASNTLADADGLGGIGYQWKADGSDITGATASTFLLTETQVGKTITVSAGYTDGHGTAESVASGATAAVANVNDAPAGSITISGTATQGQTLNAVNNLADADGLGTIGYQWKADSSDITGATASTFRLTEAQVGKTIMVSAGYTDGHGTAESVASGATAAVANVNDAPTGSVTIADNPTQGQTLTALNTLADADGLGSIGYQWKADGSDITGATASTFRLTEAQAGKTITLSASYIDGHGTAESVASSATAAVANLNDAPTGSVTIAGNSTQGQTLTASNTLADADGLGTITYLWQSGGASSWTTVGSGEAITLFEPQVGKQIQVLACYTDGHGTSEVVASANTTEVLGYKAGTEAGDALAGTPYAESLLGLAGNDTLTGGGGDDTIDGGSGTDIAVYSGNMSDYSITNNTNGSHTIKDQRVFVLPGGEGGDALTSVERLRFSDRSLALDLSGNAGAVAKIIGAVFGAESVANGLWVGFGLGYIDGGMSYQDLTQLALNLRLGTGFTDDAEVTLLYQNLFGISAGQADLSYWSGTITSHQFSQASLAAMAAESSSNAANINLVGLAQTGIEYS